MVREDWGVCGSHMLVQGNVAELSQDRCNQSCYGTRVVDRGVWRWEVKFEDPDQRPHSYFAIGIATDTQCKDTYFQSREVVSIGWDQYKYVYVKTAGRSGNHKIEHSFDRDDTLAVEYSAKENTVSFFVNGQCVEVVRDVPQGSYRIAAFMCYVGCRVKIMDSRPVVSGLPRIPRVISEFEEALTSLHEVTTILHNASEIELYRLKDELMDVREEMQRALDLHDKCTAYILRLDSEISRMLHPGPDIYKSWTPKDIANWIGSLQSGRWGRYKKVLRDRMTLHGISGSELELLSRDDLERFGIVNFRDAHDLYLCVRALVANRGLDGVTGFLHKSPQDSSLEVAGRGGSLNSIAEGQERSAFATVRAAQQQLQQQQMMLPPFNPPRHARAETAPDHLPTGGISPAISSVGNTPVAPGGSSSNVLPRAGAFPAAPRSSPPGRTRKSIPQANGDNSGGPLPSTGLRDLTGSPGLVPRTTPSPQPRRTEGDGIENGMTVKISGPQDVEPEESADEKKRTSKLSQTMRARSAGSFVSKTPQARISNRRRQQQRSKDGTSRLGKKKRKRNHTFPLPRDTLVPTGVLARQSHRTLPHASTFVANDISSIASAPPQIARPLMLDAQKLFPPTRTKMSSTPTTAPAATLHPPMNRPPPHLSSSMGDPRRLSWNPEVNPHQQRLKKPSMGIRFTQPRRASMPETPSSTRTMRGKQKKFVFRETTSPADTETTDLPTGRSLDLESMDGITTRFPQQAFDALGRPISHSTNPMLMRVPHSTAPINTPEKPKRRQLTFGPRIEEMDRRTQQTKSARILTAHLNAQQQQEEVNPDLMRLHSLQSIPPIPTSQQMMEVE